MYRVESGEIIVAFVCGTGILPVVLEKNTGKMPVPPTLEPSFAAVPLGCLAQAFDKRVFDRKAQILHGPKRRTNPGSGGDFPSFIDVHIKRSPYDL